MIYTITLNPAFDLHYEMDFFYPEAENYVKKASRSAGGKGINVSKALCALGVENAAIAVLGSENSEDFLKELEGINLSVIETEGRIRENITIHPKEGKETRISLDNFSLSGEILDRVKKVLSGRFDGESTVVFAGRIPKGLNKDEVKAFLNDIKKTGAKLVLDSNSFDLSDISELKPFLIKPNEEEIKALFKDCNEDYPLLAEKLNLAGVENVMISLGKDGVYFSGSGESFFVKAPEITPVSTIGAGDSTIAGFLAGLEKGYPIKDSVCLAVASGSAACLTEGTSPPMADDIERLSDNLKNKNLI